MTGNFKISKVVINQEKTKNEKDYRNYFINLSSGNALPGNIQSNDSTSTYRYWICCHWCIVFMGKEKPVNFNFFKFYYW
ncbi:hypothetical protein BH23BAC1_BH23BAC1_07560 [soil metagenome]